MSCFRIQFIQKECSNQFFVLEIGFWFSNLAENWLEIDLYRAAKKGDLPICRLIIEHLPDKNPRNFLESGDTLLHWAAKKGHLSLCKLIVKNVQDKNPKGKNGQTPLHVAALNGHTAICQLFLDNIKGNLLKGIDNKTTRR